MNRTWSEIAIGVGLPEGLASGLGQVPGPGLVVGLLLVLVFVGWVIRSRERTGNLERLINAAARLRPAGRLAGVRRKAKAKAGRHRPAASERNGRKLKDVS